MSAFSRLELSKFLPHGNEMCLLSSVEYWDASSITCLTSTHRNQDNPLRRQGVLGMIAGLEYAAQALAVHIGLTTDISKRNASVGYLGAVRDLQVHSRTFQQFTEDLTIEANILLQQSMSFIYTFSIRAQETPLLQGRASIFIQGLESQA